MARELKCPECGTFYENFDRYSGCPKGHGKLMPLLSKKELVAIAAKTLPQAKKLETPKFRYAIDKVIYKRNRTVSGGVAVRVVTRPRVQKELQAAGKVVAACRELATGFGLFEPVPQ